MTFQYETNLWSTHVNIVRLAESIRRCVRWRTQVFKIEGFVGKRFLPSPPPPPSFIFWFSFHFSLGQNRKPLPRSFFAPKPNGNACYACSLFPHKMTSEDDVSTTQIWVLFLIGWSKFSANQKHYPDLWNFVAVRQVSIHGEPLVVES